MCYFCSDNTVFSSYFVYKDCCYEACWFFCFVEMVVCYFKQVMEGHVKCMYMKLARSFTWTGKSR